MKTVPTDASVTEFIDAVEHVGRREDARTLLGLMNEATGAIPRMWGPSIIGYGEYGYTRADGSEHRFLVTGFSPRKANMAIYLMSGCARHGDKLARLGKHRHTVSCLYIGRLTAIDTDVLTDIVRDDIAIMRRTHNDFTL